MDGPFTSQAFKKYDLYKIRCTYLVIFLINWIMNMYLQHRIKYPVFVTFFPNVFGSSSIWNLKYLLLFSSGRRTLKTKKLYMIRPNRLATKDIKNTKHFEYGVLCWKQGFHKFPLFKLLIAHSSKISTVLPIYWKFLISVVLLPFRTLKVFLIQL